jgi:carboxyl-terminal processing protease
VWILSRKKIIAGAVVLVIVTFMATVGGFLFLLSGNTADMMSTFQFFRVLEMVKSQYVEPVSTDTLVAGAINGMVKSLKDPHSVYMDAKVYNQFMSETEGYYGGVGMVLGVKDKKLLVVSPIDGTPAQKAGIKSGDQIVKIDGEDTKDMSVEEAANKIRGPEGTKIVLSILRSGEAEKDYTLIRSNIKIQTVYSKMLPDHIGYIRISMFSENTGKDFATQYQELEKQGMKAVILDLRDNPGGLLDESVKIARYFVPKGPVVSVVTRDGQKEVHYSDLAAVKYPLAVLVNGGSASAAEILSGAIQDTGAGVLIGTKTYGKGSVQTLKPLGDGSAIKLTIAKYFTPKGRSIDGIGIEPNIKVEMTAQAGGQDIQLEKAIEVVKQKMAK